MKARAILGAVVVLAALVGCARVEPGAEMQAGRAIFRAQGTSVPAKADDALSIEEAKVAAAVLAKANLLEKIKGAFIENEVKVDGLLFASQEGMTAVKGYLARATIAYEPPTRIPAESVTATATLEISKADLKVLRKYVE